MIVKDTSVEKIAAEHLLYCSRVSSHVLGCYEFTSLLRNARGVFACDIFRDCVSYEPMYIVFWWSFHPGLEVSRKVLTSKRQCNCLCRVDDSRTIIFVRWAQGNVLFCLITFDSYFVVAFVSFAFSGCHYYHGVGRHFAIYTFRDRSLINRSFTRNFLNYCNTPEYPNRRKNCRS